MLWILGIVALGIGIWVGLGLPGMPGGREDRIVAPGRARRLKHNYIHWYKTRR
jgi:hypothetical protein